MLREIAELYSQSAYEFSEQSKKWMPEWLTKHKALSQIKGTRVFKIFSIFGLNDFRKPIDSSSNLEDFKDLLISELSNIVNSVMKIKDRPETAQIEQVGYKLINHIMRPGMWASDRHKLIEQVASNDKKFRIDAGTSIVKAYNIVKAYAVKLGVLSKNIETTQEFRNYSNRGSQFVVFSTNPEDIAAMSSRSNWDSCQTLDVSKGTNACVIGSTLSKFIGIAYITTGSSWEDKGERMIARCLIRFAIDTRNNKPAIIVDRMYPSYNAAYAHQMTDALQEKSSVPVHDIQHMQSQDIGRFKLPEEEIQGMMEHEKSYLDNPEVFSVEHHKVKDPVSFIRSYARDLSKWLEGKVFVYIRKSINNSSIKWDHSYKIISNKIISNIISNIVKTPSSAVARHYQNGGKPMDERMIKKILLEDLFKIKNKTVIKETVNFFVSNNEATLSGISNIKRPLIEYIFDQLTNLPEELAI